MAPWPSGKAKVCNTSITSSNLVGASKESKKFLKFLGFFVTRKNITTKDNICNVSVKNHEVFDDK